MQRGHGREACFLIERQGRCNALTQNQRRVAIWVWEHRRRPVTALLVAIRDGTFSAILVNEFNRRDVVADPDRSDEQHAFQILAGAGWRIA